MNLEKMKSAAANYADALDGSPSEKQIAYNAFNEGADYATKAEKIENLKGEIERLDAQRVADRPALKSETITALSNALANYELLAGEPYVKVL